MNLANKLTLMRVALIPVFVFFYCSTLAVGRYIALAVFIIAYVTDIFDGRYARKHNMVTDFGKLMDPAADKLLTTTALILLVWDGSLHPLFAIIIIGREFVINGFRLIAVGKGCVIAAGKLGKLKTVSQCVAISFMMIEVPLFDLTGIMLGQIFMYVAVILTVWSGADYIYKNRELISLK